MAKRQTGQFMKVMLGAVEVMLLREWSYSAEVEMIESTAAGDVWAKNETGVKSWEGEAEVVDVDEFYITQLGDKVTVQFFAHEDDTDYEEGEAYLSGVDKSSSYDDLVEQSLSFTGDGPLAKKTLPA